jgi:uncharacterized membrane protein
MVQSQSTALRIQAAAFSGPLPPPDALERYNQIVPGAAERIIAMAESQHTHRQALEKHVIHSNISAQRLGTVLGFVVAMTVVIGGMYLIHEGKSGEGLAAILTALASLVGVFLYSKHEQRKELAKKTEALTHAAQR